MHTAFFIDKGGYLMEHKKSGGNAPAPFPVCLAIKYGDHITECPDFILNIEESWVFVRTPSPLPEGTSLVMHFYIPPENKLLAEAAGKVAVVHQGDADYPAGMMVKISFFSRKKMQRLRKYLGAEEHLIDQRA